jgi:hypothetical protein
MCPKPAKQTVLHPESSSLPPSTPPPCAAQVPSDPAELAAVQRRLAARYPVGAFNAARRRMDPHNILGSPMMDALLPHSSSSA